MRESVFIRQNLDNWAAWQRDLRSADAISPDTLASTYRALACDLAYAQTHYPRSRVTTFLNDLTLAYHVRLYRRCPSTWHKVRTFWTRDIPLALAASRRELVAALLVFLIGVGIGFISQQGDENFARLVMGDNYINMTISNIEAGEPMAVYDGEREDEMFLDITINNIFVALRCFACGILTLFGTGIMLLDNAIMLGAFQTFFVQQDLLRESMLAVWLHGTLEISAIIVAGAAGIALGTGWLYPGNMRRIDAFKAGALRGVKVVLATVPMFVVAGFIEGFFTRHTHWPDALRLSIIILSALLVVLYIIVWPAWVEKRQATSDK